MEDNKNTSRRDMPALSPYLERKLPYWEKRYGFFLAAIFGLIAFAFNNK